MTATNESQQIKEMLAPIDLQLVAIERVDYPYEPEQGQILESTFVLVYESQDDADVFNVRVEVVKDRLLKMGLDTHQYFPGWRDPRETAQA